MNADYDAGYRAGVTHVAQCLRKAADLVEQPVRGTAEKDGKRYDIIAKSGQPHFARSLRQLADELSKVCPD